MTCHGLTGREETVPAIAGLHWHKNGQATLSGALLRYFTRLDAAIVEYASTLGARPLRAAPCLPPGVPQRCGYLASFPHHATVATPLMHTSDRGAPASDATLLTPAACYHVYPFLEDMSLATPAVYTISATCFRNEKVFLPLERQWAFSMREIVCVGTDEEVRKFLTAIKATALDWCETLDVPVRCVGATDPFFDPRNSPGWLMQRLLPLKTELLADELAVASFNIHQSFFGETFNIRRGDRPAWTGCAAFGLERWLLALIRRHGADPERWPAPVGRR